MEALKKLIIDFASQQKDYTKVNGVLTAAGRLDDRGFTKRVKNTLTELAAAGEIEVNHAHLARLGMPHYTPVGGANQGSRHTGDPAPVTRYYNLLDTPVEVRNPRLVPSATPAPKPVTTVRTQPFIPEGKKAIIINGPDGPRVMEPGMYDAGEMKQPKDEGFLTSGGAFTNSLLSNLIPEAAAEVKDVAIKDLPQAGKLSEEEVTELATTAQMAAPEVAMPAAEPEVTLPDEQPAPAGQPTGEPAEPEMAPTSETPNPDEL
jgi:hypothetical protein